MEESKRIERSIITTYRKTVWNKFIEGVKTYEMIAPGDRIAVCMSGGKDSALLAKCMQELQKHGEMPFTLRFLVMDPGYSEENRRRIVENAARLDIPIEIKESDIFESVESVGKNPCYLCARMRRGYLYSFAREMGCNKIALGHHFDDVIETTLMGLLYGAQMQTMLPKLRSSNFEGMELIRPLYCVRERDIIRFVRYNKLEFLRCACKRTLMDAGCEAEGVSKRRLVKELIAGLEKDNSQVPVNIFRAPEDVRLTELIGYTGKDGYHRFTDEY